MRTPRRRAPVTAALSAVAALVVAACGTGPIGSPSGLRATAPDALATGSIRATESAGTLPPGAVVRIPAPGPRGTVYPPNPGAIVVALDPGHGGCLDWGVPDPSQRGEPYAEKSMTLAIAELVAERLRAEGVRVVLTRTADEALAGDLAPQLGCHGPPFRDVNGDGEVGFEETGRVRGRDELQARLDLANLAGADLLVSIHINSITQDGVPYPIAATESFYTDETPWGVERTAVLARHVHDGVVAALGGVAGYEREDRGVRAHNLFIVAPPLWEPTAERPDPSAQPARGALMPSVLVEVGSITRREEHDLLMSDTGRQAAADGIVKGIGAWLSERETAARIELAAEAGDPSPQPPTAAGGGPPFWAPVLRDADSADRLLDLLFVNSGSESWSGRTELVVGSQPSEEPYLRRAPAATSRLPLDVPALAPGESARIEVVLDRPTGEGRQLLWVTLADEEGTFADRGSPALQLATAEP